MSAAPQEGLAGRKFDLRPVLGKNAVVGIRHIYSRVYGIGLVLLGAFLLWVYGTGGGFTGTGPIPEPSPSEAIGIGLFFLTVGILLLIMDRFPLTGGFPTEVIVESGKLSFTIPRGKDYQVSWNEKTYAQVAKVAPPRVWDQRAGGFRNPLPGEKVKGRFIFGTPAPRFQVPGRPGVGCTFTITDEAAQAILESATRFGLEVKELPRDDEWMYWRISGKAALRVTSRSFP